ncbi:MAG: hypothetical protein ACP5NK_07900 [Thermoplasmata archaeon]
MPLPSREYWHTLEDVLTQYVRHNDNKFDYDNEGIAHRKHIIADSIRYIGKESNNLDDVSTTGANEEDYLEYLKDHEIVNGKEFLGWTLSLRPKDVRDKGISERGLRNFKQKIRNGKGMKNRSKIAKTLSELFKSDKQN